MRIVFIGTVDLSKALLTRLISLQADVVGVVTKKDPGFNSDYCDLGPLCAAKGIECLRVIDVNSDATLEWIRARKPDIIFCFGFSQLLGDSVLSCAPMGAVGYHPSALPRNRGRHPLVWTLALGLPETASTFFFLDKGTDSGDIISQRSIPVRYEDDAGSLYAKVTETALSQIDEFYPLLRDGKCPRIPQNQLLSSAWRKRGIADGLIDFRMSSRSIYLLVRSLTKPYAGAHCMYRGKEIKVWQVREEGCNDINAEPGKVLDIFEKNILVKCFDGAVLLTVHGFPELPQKGGYII